MSLLDNVEIPRRTMVLFFVVDTSGSMGGEKIGAVNAAIQEVVPDIREVSDENADAQIKIAALEFSSGATWKTPGGPIEAEKYRWDNLNADGVTDLGAACKALNEKLSTKGFMQEATGSFAPAIILLSDGGPTDNWEKELSALKQNNWFKAGIKVAIAIGNDANKDVLKEFTGSIESVLEVHNKAMLKKMIRFVSVSASRIASKSSNVGGGAADMGDEQKQQDFNEAAQEFKVDAAAAPDNDQQEW
ncbi:MAG: VWA domain-containing protein [Spirochaetes bacterium]|nr:VWA domain-containing protein [Spirochaetota bacterium]